MTATALSDAELLTAAREGDESAFTELYARHHAAARRLAVSYRRAEDPDDLVNGAFERVLNAINRGSGPTDSFRAYLFVTLRRLATELIDRDVTDPYDEVPEPVSVEERSPVMEAAERAIVLEAYESLPDRWQAVLWHTTVEGKNPKDLAPLFGVSANAAAALAYRAREKLRQAYLQAHLQAAPHPECEPYRSQLGAYVRSGLSTRDQGKVEAHLDGCGSCRDLRAELLGINSMLNRSVLPYFLLAATEVTAVAAGAGAGAGVVGTPLNVARKGVSKARNNPGPTVVAAALAAALAAGLIAANSPSGEDPPDATAGPLEESTPTVAEDPPPDEPDDPAEPDEPAPDEPDDPEEADEPDDPEEATPPETAAPEDDPPDPTAPPAAAAEPAAAEPPATEPSPATTSPPTEPAPTEPPPTDPPPTTAPPPEPTGQVVWNPGAQAVETTIHNPGPGDTGLVMVQMSVSGGAVMSGGPLGCSGVALLVLTECVITTVPAGGTIVISQPVAGSGPGRYATVGCTFGALGLACDSLIPHSTIEMN